jgi:deoxyribodipyrimidine photo-lyase
MRFDPSRSVGLARLADFAPRSGTLYRDGRNYDLSSARSVVSQLSPWLRHRVIGEWEVLAAVTSRLPATETMPYLQEIFWRGYFKGFLEHHPSIWQRYLSDLAQAREALPAEYTQAISGRTGIACFDHWSRELAETGYLHNHARMWFASIWIFTLRLPWHLGAAHFLDRLVDADPASNTLSWRWVAGLHTKGKHYLATSDNIARFTDGRFDPKGQLNETAAPLTESVDHAFVPLAPRDMAAPRGALRLITEEDCHLDGFAGACGAVGVVSPDATDFAKGAVSACAAQYGGATLIGHDWSGAIMAAAQRLGTRAVVTMAPPVGFVRDGLDAARPALDRHGVTLIEMRRPYDDLVWPHASKGFFKVKKQIPDLLAALLPRV